MINHLFRCENHSQHTKQFSWPRLGESLRSRATNSCVCGTKLQVFAEVARKIAALCRVVWRQISLPAFETDHRHHCLSIPESRTRQCFINPCASFRDRPLTLSNTHETNPVRISAWRGVSLLFTVRCFFQVEKIGRLRNLRE